MEIRGDLKDKVYVSIGENCILNCRIVIEAETGSVIIGSNTFIGTGVMLILINNITIGDYVMIAWGGTILDHNSHSLNYLDRIDDMKRAVNNEAVNWSVVQSKEIMIANYCWIGFNSVILKGVVINEGCVIAATSTVVKTCNEKYSLYGGNPACFIKKIC